MAAKALAVEVHAARSPRSKNDVCIVRRPHGEDVVGGVHGHSVPRPARDSERPDVHVSVFVAKDGDMAAVIRQGRPGRGPVRVTRHSVVACLRDRTTRGAGAAASWETRRKAIGPTAEPVSNAPPVKVSTAVGDPCISRRSRSRGCDQSVPCRMNSNGPSALSIAGLSASTSRRAPGTPSVPT